MQSLVVVLVRLPCTHLLLIDYVLMRDNVFLRHIVIIICISLAIRFCIWLLIHVWTLSYGLCTIILTLYGLFIWWMQDMWFYMMCYACFIYHDMYVDLWSMMDIDTWLCRLLHDMMYMRLYDVLSFICKYHEWKCIMFYVICVMLLNYESNMYGWKWLNYMNW